MYKLQLPPHHVYVYFRKVQQMHIILHATILRATDVIVYDEQMEESSTKCSTSNIFAWKHEPVIRNAAVICCRCGDDT